jgi:hypothetical protein
MSNYTKTVNFAAKDALTTGDANKVVKGTEIDTEYNNIATAVATKYDSSSSIPASVISAATFGTGDYAFASTSRLQLGPISPSASHRFTSTCVDLHPAGTFNMGSNASSTGVVITDQVSGSTTRLLTAFATGTFPGTNYASISTNGTTVSYNTTSDYRLKSNVQPLANSIVKVKALKPCSYTWIKAPDIQNQGFLAHELAAVIPQAVIGEKDAVNADGSIRTQQVDLSYVIPLLTSALQEAIAKIEALEVRITALESK